MTDKIEPESFDTADEEGKPQAHSTSWYRCDHCEHLHVRLLDENDEVIATAVINREGLVNMLAVIDEVLPPIVN